MKVTDEAVKVFMRAIERPGEYIPYAQEAREKIVRAALEAALPKMIAAIEPSQPAAQGEAGDVEEKIRLAFIRGKVWWVEHGADSPEYFAKAARDHADAAVYDLRAKQAPTVAVPDGVWPIEDGVKELRRLRAVRGLSLRDLAAEIGIGHATLARIEKGAVPDMETARKLLPFMGLCACCGRAAIAKQAPTVAGDVERFEMRGDTTDERIGFWLSAALEDPTVSADFKADIDAWFRSKQAPAVAVPEGWKLVPVEFIEFVKSAPVSSGVCCCGDDMERHSDPMSCGHTPVDQWDYSLTRWLEQIAAAPSHPAEERS